MPPKEQVLRPAVFAVAGAAAALTLTACAAMPGGSAQDNTPDEVSTDISGIEAALTLAYVDDPPTQQLVEGFTSRYPDVSIELQQTAFVDYVDTVSLAMTSDDAPDIAQYNAGAMRRLIAGGHLLDLDPYSEAYGWEQSFPASALDTMRLPDDASQYGTGSLYAAPGALSLLGVFYNDELLEEAGVSEQPTTTAEFERALEAVEEAGTTAFSVGGLETGGNFVWTALANAYADPDEYRDWVHGAPGSTIETEGMVEATETFSRWVEEGYVPEASNATSDADAQAQFVDGESAFLITGNWAALTLELEMEGSAGFFLMPGADPAAPVASGSSVGFSVSSETEHPDVAAAFLDYLRSAEAAAVQVETGFMPVDPHADTEAYGLLNQVNHAFAGVADAEGIVSFPDIAAPGIIDQITPGVQALIAQEQSPEDFLADIQAEWASHNDE